MIQKIFMENLSQSFFFWNLKLGQMRFILTSLCESLWNYPFFLIIFFSFSGDFDFIVRRTQIPDKQGKLHAVAFVEPVKFRDGPPRPNDIRYGLLPGDQLLRINGTSIDVLSRNDLSTLMEVFISFLSFFVISCCIERNDLVISIFQ